MLPAVSETLPWLFYTKKGCSTPKACTRCRLCALPRKSV